MPDLRGFAGQPAGLQDLNLGGNVFVLGGISCKEFSQMVATVASSPSLSLCIEADAARPTLLSPPAKQTKETTQQLARARISILSVFVGERV